MESNENHGQPKDEQDVGEVKGQSAVRFRTDAQIQYLRGNISFETLRGYEIGFDQEERSHGTDKPRKVN